MSRSEVLARAEDDNGYWAMVGQRGRVHNVHCLV
jgi:hypothetical protein